MSPPPPIAISTQYSFGRSQQASKIHQCIWMVKTRASEQASKLPCFLARFLPPSLSPPSLPLSLPPRFLAPLLPHSLPPSLLCSLPPLLPLSLPPSLPSLLPHSLPPLPFSERASEQASQRAKNLVFGSPPPLKFKKVKQVWLRKIVVRCPHHLQKELWLYLYSLSGKWPS